MQEPKLYDGDAFNSGATDALADLKCVKKRKGKKEDDMEGVVYPGDPVYSQPYVEDIMGKPAVEEKELEEGEKFNPHHGAGGRFASSGGGGAAPSGGGGKKIKTLAGQDAAFSKIKKGSTVTVTYHSTFGNDKITGKYMGKTGDVSLGHGKSGKGHQISYTRTTKYGKKVPEVYTLLPSGTYSIS